MSGVGDDGFIVLGLFGDALLPLRVSTELNDSWVSSLARENVECIELTSVLELLPGSRVQGGRIGVEGLDGTGRKLLRLCTFTPAVSRRKGGMQLLLLLLLLLLL
jgi:hypothetical protein